ncbi:MAG: PAS domain S-box protein [Bacteroidales bacterium]|nr:PAS domain S-box protein [Bacteroidales bacterium]MDZ4203824.1 PAS domain S-box protein [Bacteroidales bacterium]
MNIIVLLVFFCFIAYLFLGISLYCSDRKSGVGRLFLAISVSLSIWAIAYTFMFSAPDSHDAMLWRRLSTFGWAGLFSILLHFFLVLTKQRTILSKKWVFPVIYLPAIVFLYVFTSESWMVSTSMIEIGGVWGFMFAQNQYWFWVFIAYCLVILMSIVILTLNWDEHSTFFRHRSKSRIVAILIIIVCVLGFATDGFLPALGVYYFPPLAILFCFFPMLGVWFALKRYRIVLVSPEVLSSDILRNLSEGILLIDIEGKIKHANQSALKIIGCSEDNIISQPLTKIFPNIDIGFPIPAKPGSDYLKNQHKVTVLNASDRPFPVDFSATLLFDNWGDSYGLICSFQDVSGRIHAEEMLNRERERVYFEQLFDIAPVGIVLLNDDDQVVDCNSEFTRLFQYTKEEATGKKINDLITPDYLKDEASNITNSVFNGQSVYKETTRKRKDGQLVEVALIGKPFGVKPGQITIYGIYQDITERKKAEKELKRHLLFQELAVMISSRFAATSNVDATIDISLAEIGHFVKADRAYLFLINKDGITVSNTHEWCAPGVLPQKDNLQQLSTDLIPWWMAKLHRNEAILVDDVALMPAEAAVEEQLLESQDIKSLLVLPVHIGRKLAGFIGFDYVNEYLALANNDLAILKVAAEVIGHSLERVQFRDALMQERDLLQALMDNIPDAIYFKDTQSRFTRINKALANVLGIAAAEEAIGKTDFDYFNKEHAQHTFEEEQKLFLEGTPVIDELDRFRTLAHWQWMSATKVPLRDADKKIIGMVGISHDMTEFKRIEDTLRSREGFLSHLNKITSLALKSSTSSGFYQFLADQLLELFSSDISFITLWDEESHKTIPMAASGLAGENYFSLSILPGEVTMTESVIAARKPIVVEDVYNTPYVCRRIADLFPTKSMLALPLLVDDLNLGAVLIGFSTPHKFTDEEIDYGTIAANQIALVVAKTNMVDQLIENEQNLMKLHAEKDKLFSIIAHDLRSPFTSFLGLTELMADSSMELTYEEMREFAQAIQKSASGLYQLLENMLEWSRLQGGYVEFTPGTVDLHELVNHNFDSLKAAALRKEIETIIDIPADFIIQADQNMIRSLTGNFISNAIKFTPRGGKVTVAARHTEDGWVQVEVEDTGIGVPEETINNLFRIDMKIATQGTEGEPSSGLGLILCKEFVEKHGGKIWVESQVGKGSKFVFQIPGNLQTNGGYP